MIIELKNKRVAYTRTIYYKVFIDEKFEGKLRVSNHPSLKRHRFNYHSVHPKNVNEDVLIDYIKDILTKSDLIDKIEPRLRNKL